MDIGLMGIAAALSLAGLGSAMGMGAAGQAAVGAWKKCYMQGRQAPFMLVAFVGAPLTQTIYGYILMNSLSLYIGQANSWLLFGSGVFGGIALGMSSYAQGKIGASACDAFAETNKGFANYLLLLGLTESAALFVMVFLMIFKYA